MKKSDYFVNASALKLDFSMSDLEYECSKLQTCVDFAESL